ncbi:glutathione S-transferase family protein [Ruegeria jejuensis]|uniref:glutathione S-transferase family protein n=1 Tax=Ruegeria jejuensis TaxID=3233338 RepID=UPI00355AFDC3
MYKVYGKPVTRAFRVLWMMEEIGADYELIPAPSRSPEVTAVNPSGKVPVLEVEGASVSDSTAILTFLADRHGALTHPAGTIERAMQDAVTHLLLDEMDAVLWTAARHSFVLPQERRTPEVKESLKWEFERNLTRLAERIDGPYLCGDQMTIADIICVHCLDWAVGAKFPFENQTLAEYAKPIRARAAFQRVRAMAS